MKRISLIFGLSLVFAGLAVGQKQAPAVPESGAVKVPVSYGLVIDNSGSYRTLLEKVINLVLGIVEENKPGDEAFLVTFVDTSKIVLRQDFTDHKADLKDSVENMFIEGGQTAILDAVKFSADHLTADARVEPDRSKVLVLVTDGDERLSASHIDDVVKSLKAGNIRVFVVAIAEEKIYTKVIDRLVKDTGGVKYSPRTRDEIAATIKNLSTAIRTK